VSPPNHNKIRNISAKITRGLSTQEQKATAIFNWLAGNIDYDSELRFNTSLQKEIYTTEENVIIQAIRREKALCGGYALLYRELCKYADVQVEVIHGYTKNTSGTKRKSKQVHHTWNAVKIDGSWRLLDITWAISHGTSNRPNQFWFQTLPKDFIKTHLPENAQWTLLQNVVTLAEFDK
jgi:transglutaminase/protease-like cytokinesis protein 3